VLPLQRWLASNFAVLAALAFNSLAHAEPAESQAPWCAPELQTIAEHTCYFSPEAALQKQPRVLIIFLHGLTGAGGSWQWDQQRLMTRTAKAHGFSVLIPRGRPGIGPGRDPKILAWPNSKKAQEAVEADVLADLNAARSAAEQQSGKFEKVLVFGFSNGAYYATSLALRAKLNVDGFGVFAGGSGNKYDAILAAKAERRVPIFVGYGTRDPDRQRQIQLVSLLRKQGWKHRAKAARVGHTVTDDQIRTALRFLVQAEPKTDEPER
jgi:predicted esterase